MSQKIQKKNIQFYSALYVVSVYPCNKGGTDNYSFIANNCNYFRINPDLPEKGWYYPPDCDLSELLLNCWISAPPAATFSSAETKYIEAQTAVEIVHVLNLEYSFSKPASGDS